MLRERPLTWLFILATVVVDLAISVTREEPISGGVLIGQVAAIAIWTVIGHPHRLIRGSLLVVAVGGLAALTEGFVNYSRSLAFMAAYAVAMVSTSLIVVWLRNQVRIRFNCDPPPAPLRVPLIELFGWTIVVAVASFGARYMEPSFWKEVLRVPSPYLLLYAISPMSLLLFDSRFRTLHLVKAALFIGGVYLASSFLSSRLSQRDIPEVITGVAAYLTIWLLVRSIEYDQIKTSEEEVGKTKLFDADE
jgi:hypothetical protein